MKEKVHILYIEDDTLDIRNLEWLADQVDHVQLTICQSFEKVASILSANTIDLIITDQYVKADHYSNYLSHFKQLDYIVLSNTTDLKKSTILYPPLKSFKKPLTLDVFKSLFEANSSQKVASKYDYFDTITDEEYKERLISLLKSEFENVLLAVPKLLNDNNLEEIRQIVHKVSSKFSLLQMKEPFDLARNIEKELTIDVLSNDKIQLLLENTETAFTYLNSK